MKKSKFIFAIIYLGVAISIIYFFPHSSKNKIFKKKIPLEISYLTRKEKLYKDKNFTKPIDINEKVEYGKIYNKNSCYSLIFQNNIIRIGKNSAIQIKEDNFKLIKGKISWFNIDKKEAIQCVIGNYKIKIKDMAEIINQNGGIKIRALRGNIDIKGIEGIKKIEENKELSTEQGESNFSINTILPAPKFIEPKKTILNMNDNGFFYFSWSPVKEAKEYHLNIYKSMFPDSLIYNKSFKGHRVKLNLNQELKAGIYFVQIQAISNKDVYGKVSDMKKIDLRGVIIKKSNFPKQKEFIVKTSSNGFLATIKGTADTDGKLFINDEKWFINKDGTFSKTIEYHEFGRKTINIKYITPEEEVIEKKEEVIIFEE